MEFFFLTVFTEKTQNGLRVFSLRCPPTRHGCLQATTSTRAVSGGPRSQKGTPDTAQDHSFPNRTGNAGRAQGPKDST